MWIADKVKSSVQCNNGATLSVWRSFSLFSSCFSSSIAIFVCFSVSLHFSSPVLFLFAFLLLSLSLSLSVCFPPLFSLCVSLRKRLQHCGGGCDAGADFFFIRVLLSELAHHLGYTHICTHTHTPQTSNTRQMLTTNSHGLELNKKSPQKSGPNSTQLTWRAVLNQPNTTTHRTNHQGKHNVNTYCSDVRA